MLHWISANLSTILITLVLIAIVVLIIRGLVRQKKQGKSSCGAGCAHCAMHGQCPSQPAVILTRGETWAAPRLPPPLHPGG